MWYPTTDSGTQSNDPDVQWAQAYLSTDPDEGASYEIYFEPYGEMLWLIDGMSDGHAAMGEVLVYNTNGDLVDEDKFCRTTSDDPSDTINLGTPDGSGNIPDRYRVWVRVCINETSTCTPYVKGIARAGSSPRLHPGDDPARSCRT